jgi:hypothetical protein
MILAGVDEAGYGPLLGPLVVGSCAISVPGAVQATGDIPTIDLWKSLRAAVSRKRSKDGRKLHIADSKAVYSPSAGLSELERSVVSVVACAGSMPPDLDALLRQTSPQSLPHLARHAWYATSNDEVFPTECSPASVAIAANGLRLALQDASAQVVRYAASVVPESQYNDLVTRTRNKASVLFTLAATHLDALIRMAGDDGAIILCDRQGGRSHYRHLLMDCFPDHDLTVVSETDSRADYMLVRGRCVVRVSFAEKSEDQHLPTAAASMLCKYLRETMMGRFNRWWAQRVPGVGPTAGYYTDGHRFLGDIRPHLPGVGVREAELVRIR